MGRQNIGGVVLVTYPIDGSDLSSSPTNKVEATSCKHAYLAEANFGLKSTDTPVAGSWFLHRANGNETIQSFSVGCMDTGSSASITFDLKKNGASVLSGLVTVANTDPDRTTKAGTVSSVSLTNDDVLTVVIATSSTTGMQGPFAQCAIIAAASPN